MICVTCTLRFLRVVPSFLHSLLCSCSSGSLEMATTQDCGGRNPWHWTCNGNGKEAYLVLSPWDFRINLLPQHNQVYLEWCSLIQICKLVSVLLQRWGCIEVTSMQPSLFLKSAWCLGIGKSAPCDWYFPTALTVPSHPSASKLLHARLCFLHLIHVFHPCPA